MSKITIRELHPSLVKLINSGGTGTSGSVFKHTKKTVHIDTPVSEVTIGIPNFDKDNDCLMVFKNSTYIEKDIDYSISPDGSTIIPTEGQWNTLSSNMVFNFILLKNVSTTEVVKTRMSNDNTVNESDWELQEDGTYKITKIHNLNTDKPLVISYDVDGNSMSISVKRVSETTVDIFSNIAVACNITVINGGDNIIENVIDDTKTETNITWSSTKLSNEFNNANSNISKANEAANEAKTKAEQAFQFASDGKQKIATAITGKGVPASGTETFESLSTKITSIQTGEEIAKIDYDPSLDLTVKNNLIKENTELIIFDLKTKNYIIRDKGTNNIYWIDPAGEAILLHPNYDKGSIVSAYLDMEKKLFIAQAYRSVIAINLDTLKVTHQYSKDPVTVYYDGPGGIIVMYKNSTPGWTGKNIYDAYTGELLLNYTVTNSGQSYATFNYCKSIDKFYRVIYDGNNYMLEIYNKTFNRIYNQSISAPGYGLSMKTFGDTLLDVSAYPDGKSDLLIDSMTTNRIINLNSYTVHNSGMAIKNIYNYYKIRAENKLDIYNSVKDEYLSRLGYIRFKTMNNSYLCNIDEEIRPISISKFYNWAVFKDGSYTKNDKTFKIVFNTDQSKYISFARAEAGNIYIEILTKTGFVE